MTGIGRHHHQEDWPSIDRRLVWWANDSRPVQHGRGKVGWLPPRSGHVVHQIGTCFLKYFSYKWKCEFFFSTSFQPYREFYHSLIICWWMDRIIVIHFEWFIVLSTTFFSPVLHVTLGIFYFGVWQGFMIYVSSFQLTIKWSDAWWFMIVS